MRPQHIIAIAVSAVLVALSLTLVNREPTYQGRSLTQWIVSYEEQRLSMVRFPQPTGDTPVRAVKAIGTNGIPFLLRWIRDGKTAPRQLFGSGNTKSAQMTRSWVPILRHVGEAVVDSQTINALGRAEIGRAGFQMLGIEASCAIPQLVGLMNGNEAKYPGCAAGALAFLGPEAVAPICAALADPKHRDLQGIINATRDMRYLGTDAEPLIPLLCNYLHSPDSTLAAAAASSLGSLKLSSDKSVPALAAALKSSSSDVRLHSSWALQSFGDRAATATPELLDNLTHSDLATSFAAAQTLARNQLSPSTVIPKVTPLLDSPNMQTRVVAAFSLAGYGSKQAIPVLITVINSTNTLPGDIKDQAVFALARFGTNAISAIPTLRSALTNNPTPFQKAIIADAISKITFPQTTPQ